MTIAATVGGWPIVRVHEMMCLLCLLVPTDSPLWRAPFPLCDRHIAATRDTTPTASTEDV